MSPQPKKIKCPECHGDGHNGRLEYTGRMDGDADYGICETCWGNKEVTQLPPTPEPQDYPDMDEIWEEQVMVDVAD